MVRVAGLFSQTLSLFSRTEFHSAVREHGAEKYSKGFSCWDQFVAMLFCQLAQAKSLREISSGLSCCLGKLQHLGMKRAPSRSTLSYANARRPWELYETVFGQLLARCHTLAHGRRAKFRFRNKLYSLDSTVIDLCVTMFDWARFRRTKGAIKLHLLLDHEGYVPCFGVVTNGRVSDVKMAWAVNLPADSIIVMDRGYVDYLLFGQWCEAGVWFVTRMKEGTNYRVVEKREASAAGMRRDEVIELTGREASVKCPNRLRRIHYRDVESGDDLVFLTNHLGFAATTIARIYRDRWQVELFFKELKQNLKVKTFVGTSANAVRVQIWTALIAMPVLKFLQLKARYGWSLSKLVALLRWNLFTYRDLWEWLDNPDETPPIGSPGEQLALGLS